MKTELSHRDNDSRWFFIDFSGVNIEYCHYPKNTVTNFKILSLYEIYCHYPKNTVTSNSCLPNTDILHYQNLLPLILIQPGFLSTKLKHPASKILGSAPLYFSCSTSPKRMPFCKRLAYTITHPSNRHKSKRDEDMDDNRKQPKFKIGDIVVVTVYGTVGSVTEIRQLDGNYLYKVNKGDVFYSESALTLLSQYKAKPIETEKIEIEYKFYFGDLVFVQGYDNDVFIIVGIHTEIWRYKEGAWEDVIYELARVTDGEWLEAGEDELTLLADFDQAETFLQKYSLKYFVKKKNNAGMYENMDIYRKSEKKHLHLKKEKKDIIDGLLDVYNDYKILYEMFQDQKYKDVMDLALRNLQKFESGKGND